MKTGRKRVRKMILALTGTLFAALLAGGCGRHTENLSVNSPAAESGKSADGAYAVRTELKEYFSADPEKGIGVYGRYTELSADGEVPEVISRVLAEVNVRAKESVESRAEAFLSGNHYEKRAEGSAVTERYGYRNISCITNVTRADRALFSVLETEMESGIGDGEDDRTRPLQYTFSSHVYDTASGRELALQDFLDPAELPEKLEAALAGKYGTEGLLAGKDRTPAWTADYLGLRFYLDSDAVPEEKKSELGMYRPKAVHVSVPCTALDGPSAEAAALTPESFIAQVEKNTDYVLPHDQRTIRVEKATDESGYEQYRIVIREKDSEKAWWLEYADDESDFFVFRAKGKYYFYRLEENERFSYVYSFASPDGGYDRFANQNAQSFDSFLHEICLAVPSNPECIHMREQTRSFMDSKSGFSTTCTPNGHYAFDPEPGRGRTWLHFALIDDSLALDSRNVGCRLLTELGAAELDEAGNTTGEIVIPAGEVLRFLRVDGESELYYYMSPEYNLYKSGARDYFYDCELLDGRTVRLTTSYENSFFVDGMYMDRIGEPVSLGAARYEAGLTEIPEHYVTIGGREYKLVRDLSLKSESGEEIDFDGDVWWEVENYVGTFASENGDAKLVISPDGEAGFDYEGRHYTGRLPEKRYYRSYAEIYMEAGYERRTFVIIPQDAKVHDPAFGRIRFFSEGEPATNEPSRVPPIEVELVRDSGL